ncbi:MAG: PD-(D/E)XK nuclease family protein [Bacteroidetes bacterium]|nr:PD-(D/E)XK nuclease family protein [Bacteroidota bacterium]
MKKSKNIKEIYNEVKNYDLVITTDVPLASALNRNTDKPRLGLLAMTPRQLALKFGTVYYDRIYSKSELILEIYKKSKKPLRYIHQSVEKIFEIWNHTGLLESCELYLGQEKELLGFFSEYRTVEFAMENFDEEFYGDKKIAVAGLELFNVLDRQVLPKKDIFYENKELLSSEEFSFSENKTYLFNSYNDLINSVLSLVNPKNQNEVALIFNTDSELKNIFTTGLSQKGVRVESKSLLRDDISAGRFLSFIESSFNVWDHSVKDVLFAESLFGINIKREFAEYNLQGYLNTDEGKKIFLNIYELMTGIGDLTFSELLDKTEFISGKKFNPELRNVFNITGLGKNKITEDNFNVLKYFILNFDIETGKSEQGVLLVNASNAAFVDRPLTVFIGMDDSWTRLNTDKAYVEKITEEKKDLEKFQILLSQGKEKIYLAINIRKNQPVIPCYYFNMLSGKDIKGFGDEFFNPVFALIKSEKKKRSKQTAPKVNSGPADFESYISPSSLNTFYICPKRYSYGKIIPQEQKSYFLKGTLLHCFAEFYFNYPEYSREKFDAILDLILKKYSGFLREFNKDTEKTSFEIGMKVIMDFIDSQNFDYEIDTSKNAGINNRESNFLFPETGLGKRYLNTEQWLKKELSGISGKIDLASGQTIVDYKSSKGRKSETDLIKEYKVEILGKEKAESANFQTVAYLAAKREENPDEKIRFIYLYILLKFTDYIKGIQDPEKSITSVTYIPDTFKRYIISNEFYDCLYPKIELLKTLSYEIFRKFILDNFDQINFYDLSSVTEILENKIHGYLLENGINHKHFNKRKDETFRDNIIKPLFKELNKARTGSKEYPHIYKDEVDEFLDFAKETLKEINEFKKSDFPNRPVYDLRSICANCDYLNICTGNKLLTADED